ncbi:site-specific DNA-methyltransferase [Aliarcobacter butzleri]|uniref:site-specific DNA-methyltransferase (adenine-specific) n=1 Tax=Aliarcobacter butzleri TaxID=28197 RepID=A0AAP4Q0N7_9BACT|nr:site-specific DNA-methyltransferase [Aliarcobacter butzleri]MCG3681347.1 site-specific DNA-methyltransferase [Aliarcobacter butzleri]MCT7575594.1 site-specific DNA-methyltransferase [Aliarcobacter butzleri]MDN5053142.1 site-specific DNA-methyltransferase [Aliarcobacter butzleri]MDN5076296.1 site-specific DNA-methyltransferase [Aliarcobacter butzleri]MDN5117554.1 site-specific DNA-methyltransferase [Aliarcobacter butzleri]
MSLEKNVIEEQSINDVNYELLKKQFPHAVSIDENGKYVIDPQKLQMSLDPSLAQIKEDGYGLNWVGKKEAYHNAFTKNYKVLKPLKDYSKNWDNTENILIKGDNLDALKILRQNYFESIKMIYIDPPYNTKNDGFVYNDNFTTSTGQTLEELGYDKEYIDYIENIQGAKTHSGWLSFMYPRLLLAKDLLKDDGVIFISIDDNEFAQLKILCDEIFGESCFVADAIWRSTDNSNNDAKQFSSDYNHTFIYSKNSDWLPLKLLDESKSKHFKNPDNNPNGPYFDGNPLNSPSLRINLTYDIISPNGNIIKPPKNGWRWEEKTIKEKIKTGEIYFTKDEKAIRRRTYLFDMKGLPPSNLWFELEKTGHNRQAKYELLKIIPENVFSTPKPIKLLQYIMKISNLDSNDLILDFFAGSGSTAHAVMDLNAQDNGNRKYICVQWAELTPEKSEAKKAGYETIFDITKARIDKAGDQIAKGDIGFRTFEIVEDQKQKIYQKSLEEVNQDDLLSLMEKPDISSNEEILYNLFVAETLPLSTKHQELIKDKLYLASNVAFILGDITSDELVESLKDKKECEYITVYSPNISNDKFTLEIESNISKLGIKSDKLRFRG